MLWLDYYWHKVLKRPYSLSRRIDSGKGQPVVFLHGIASTGENWRQVADKLDPEKYRVIVFDLLGFGDSPRPDWLEYSVQDHADAVVASLRRMGIRRPMILVGHSMGSLVAAHIAHKYADNVAHLILYQIPVFERMPHVKTKDLRRRAYLSLFRYMAEHRKVTLWYARVLGKIALRIAGFILDESTWQPFELSLKNTIMQQHAFANLRGLKMPTDVIYGRFDVFVLRRNLQHILRPSKRLRFYEIDEFHRVSSRTGALLHELITQDPARAEQQITVPHVRLLNMQKPQKFAHHKSDFVPHDKRLFRFAAAASLVALVTTTIALQGYVPVWELQTFFFLNGWQAPSFIDIVATLSSDIVWGGVFAVALAMLFRRFFWSAYRIAVPAVASYSVIFLTEILVGRARPDVLLPDETIQRATQDGMGFPSGHMATITILVLALWSSFGRALKVIAVVLLILVGWSRIYLGVHFPLDIIGGFVYAIVVYGVLKMLPGYIRKRLKLDP